MFPARLSLRDSTRDAFVPRAVHAVSPGCHSTITHLIYFFVYRFDLHPAGLLCALAALNHAIVPAALCLCAPVSLVSCQTNSCDIYQSFCMFGITHFLHRSSIKVQMSGKQKCYTPCGSSAFPIPRSLYSCTSCG